MRPHCGLAGGRCDRKWPRFAIAIFGVLRFLLNWIFVPVLAGGHFLEIVRPPLSIYHMISWKLTSEIVRTGCFLPHKFFFWKTWYSVSYANFASPQNLSRCPSTVSPLSRTGSKQKRVNSRKEILVRHAEKERKHTFVRVQIEYSFDCFQVQFGLVMSTVWIGFEYGFVILLDESASENHTQNSARTAP